MLSSKFKLPQKKENVKLITQQEF